jgi:anti-sigma regulatory factor (Ser/Thr protein kinase)
MNRLGGRAQAMSVTSRQGFPATQAALGEVFVFVDAWAAMVKLGEQERERLRLVIEELFLNCVIHGYGGDCTGQQVELALRAAPGESELLIEDAARAFDPFAAVESVSSSSDAAARPVGRLGLPLVVQLSTRRSYRRVGERNCVSVVLPRAPAEMLKVPT